MPRPDLVTRLKDAHRSVSFKFVCLPQCRSFVSSFFLQHSDGPRFSPPTLSAESAPGKGATARMPTAKSVVKTKFAAPDLAPPGPGPEP